MNFLVISRMKDIFTMVPLEQQMQLMDGGVAFIDKYRRAGACKEIYNMPGEKGGVSIWEVDNAEVGNRFFLENPMTPFMDVEMHVLSDWDDHAKAMKERYQQVLGQQ